MSRAVRATLLVLVVLLSGCVDLQLEERVAQRGDRATGAPPATDAPDAAAVEEPLRLDAPVLCFVDDPDCPDDRATPGSIVCSTVVRIGDEEPTADLFAELSYEGRSLVDGTVPVADLLDLDGRPVNLSFGLGGLDYPDGTYRCAFSAGSAAFETDLELTDGVDTALWDARACDREDATELSESTRVCGTDEDALPEGTTALTCSAGASPDGGEVLFELVAALDDGRRFEDLSLELGSSRLGIGVVNGTIDARAFGGQEGQPLPAGDYTCRFTLDGDEVIERELRIG